VREPTIAWVRTGVGPESARRAAEALPDAPIAAAICTGFAAALAPGLAPYTLVLADPLFDQEGRSHETPLCAALVETARAAGLAFARGALVTAPRVVATPVDKARLHGALGALAVDTESAVLACVLSARGIPAAAARVVLDAANEAIPTGVGSVWRRPALVSSGLRIAARMRPCARISARLLEAWIGHGISRAPRSGEPDRGHDREADEAYGREVHGKSDRDVEEHDRCVEQGRP